VIHSSDEEKTCQETEAAQSGEKARAIRRGLEKSMERKKKEPQIIEDIISEALQTHQRLRKILPR